MNKLFVSLLAILPLLLLPIDSYADKDKGSSDRAYDKANDNASFKRDDDKKKHKNMDADDDDDDHKKKNKEKHVSDDDDDDDHRKNDKKKGAQD